ncbi:MAG: hypothetical protein K5929_04150, partial [Lachnospiraceae bacterium]|nr:hypothetical protein [Lachnospiraceae bacterium]
MKKKILCLTLFLLLILSVTVGCSLFTPTEVSSTYSEQQVTDANPTDIIDSATDTDNQDSEQNRDHKKPSSADTDNKTETSENAEAADDSQASADTALSDTDETDETSLEEPDTDEPDTLDENGSYTSKDDVALYLYTYGKLPENFITKNDAKALGWEGGSLEPFAPGKCIGGDRFGNYEGILPKGKNYQECDIDTLGQKSRGAKRIVFSDDGYIYYTDDHYESFT